MMQPDNQHKQEFIANLTKTYQENIWKDELNIMELDELLGERRTELARLDMRLENREFKSAGEARKAIEKVKSEIEAIQAAIAGLRDKKIGWSKRIDLIKRYSNTSEPNQKP